MQTWIETNDNQSFVNTHRQQCTQNLMKKKEKKTSIILPKRYTSYASRKSNNEFVNRQK